jgi:hypothetical protein
MMPPRHERYAALLQVSVDVFYKSWIDEMRRRSTGKEGSAVTRYR